MRTIYKYTLHLGTTGISLPQGSVIRKFEEQHGQLTIWVEQDTDAPQVWRTFVILGTGFEIPDGYEYLGSVLVSGGQFVWHLFEVL